jgi:biopolymer transport protein ExbD
MDSRQDTRVTIAKRERHPDEGELDITPMIDCVFLLLSFFVVCSKVDAAAHVAMPKAHHGVTIPEDVGVVVLVMPSDTDAPKVYLGDSPAEENLCVGSIEEIEEQITQYVTEQLKDPLKVTAIIRGEKAVKYRHIDIVKRAVSAAMQEGEESIYVGIIEE